MEKLLKKSPNASKIWSLLIMSLSGFPHKHLNGEVNRLKDDIQLVLISAKVLNRVK